MESDGHQLVRRILKRRLFKCIYSGKHIKEGHCKACGINVSDIAIRKNNTI